MLGWLIRGICSIKKIWKKWCLLVGTLIRFCLKIFYTKNNYYIYTLAMWYLAPSEILKRVTSDAF